MSANSFRVASHLITKSEQILYGATAKRAALLSVQKYTKSEKDL